MGYYCHPTMQLGCVLVDIFKILEQVTKNKNRNIASLFSLSQSKMLAQTASYSHTVHKDQAIPSPRLSSVFLRGANRDPLILLSLVSSLESTSATGSSAATTTTTSATTDSTTTNNISLYKPASSPSISETMVQSGEIIKHSKAKRGKKVISLSESAIKSHFIYPQPEAARRLGVSLSTLKRRFYECYGGTKRWPYNDWKKIIKKRKISYILNAKEKPTTYIDPNTMFLLNKAFHSENH